MTYEEIISKLKSGDNFTLARYGDGEFNAILGASPGQDQKSNCDGHGYFKDMGMRLYKIIKSKPTYVMGMQSLAMRLRKNDKEFHKLIEGIEWTDSDIIHRQSIQHGISDLFETLKDRNIILVANELLVSIVYNIYDHDRQKSFDHIIIGRKDCWLEYSDILKRLTSLIEKDDVVLYCASMASEVLIDDIYNEYGDTVTQIDIGSAFDPYVGEYTRSYHKKLKI